MVLFKRFSIIDKRVLIGIVSYAIVMVVVAFVGKGTGDEGDSIQHYLFAKQAWQYKEHFFNHWAKPVYVLIAFPFAQAGLIGLKIMNILLNCSSLWVTYKVAEKLTFKWSWIPPIILASTPMFNHLSLSGLTEPMGAFILIAGIYLLIDRKWIFATILLSFLPFIRSEGLIMLMVVFFYLIVLSKYKYLPLLLTGHLIYGLVGSFHHEDIFWVFNKLTYATWASAYGSGDWLHFIKKTPEITGTILTICFGIGILYGLILLIRYLRKQTSSKEEPELILIFGSAILYFFAHTSFWALGIFNSGGILRVMITIMPLMALVSYRGVEYSVAFLQNDALKRSWIFVITMLIAIYPFCGHLFSYRWQRDFQPKADQYAQQELAKWIKEKYPDYRQHTFYYEAVYLSEVLGVDWFDKNKRKRLLDVYPAEKGKQGDFIIWDDWFAVVEGHVALQDLEKDSRLQKLNTFQKLNYWGGTRTTVVFVWK